MQNFLLKRTSGILKKFLMKQYRNFKHEDFGYIAAFLARSRDKIAEKLDQNPNFLFSEELNVLYEKIYDELNVLSIDEHWEIAKADGLEQIFQIFTALRKNSRNKELVFNRRFEELSQITAIVDPDKFPIFSLVEKNNDNDMVSLWKYKPNLLKLVEKDLGYSVYSKPSSLDHHAITLQDAGNGVFLSCPNKYVLPGTLLALVPGVIFGIGDYYPESSEKLKELSYFKRYDDSVIDFSEKIPYPFEFGRGLFEFEKLMNDRKEKKMTTDDLILVDGEMVNPFALAHKINHPPKEIAPNVVLLDLLIPNHFFTIDYLRYLPNVKFTTDNSLAIVKKKEFFHQDCFHCLAAFATQVIADGEELFQDYFQSNLISIEYPQDWLVRPPPLNPYLSKYQYENKFSNFAKIVDMFLLQDDEKDVYLRFEEAARHDGLSEVGGDFVRRKIEKSSTKNG